MPVMEVSQFNYGSINSNAESNDIDETDSIWETESRPLAVELVEKRTEFTFNVLKLLGLATSRDQRGSAACILCSQLQLSGYLRCRCQFVWRKTRPCPRRQACRQSCFSQDLLYPIILEHSTATDIVGDFSGTSTWLLKELT